ncbi:hypothetical protein NQ318_021984 [Aromia moschata]|uniref:Cathepsin propeptide inhibitor domain-containing protein n=1 Tax=Aromia moschata TaxID=1265417 RepID=A0AAV8Z796_9CUCU|nr:hypothetical protein NQ318_021984 [Aromia moschata]
MWEKIAVIFVFVIVCAMANPLPSKLEDQWRDFKTKHGKKYESDEEEARRFEIFKEAVAKIEEHNKKYEEGKVTYTMGINQFADLTQEEFKKNLGVPST